ncbi:MAG: alpha/beta fold hydrolase [Solirubrobacteraceae bacterium]
MRTEIRVPGLVCIEHTFQVPLDHARPAGATIEVFAREVADPDGTDRPVLVFLQGGPGFEAPRPTGRPRSPGWLDHALGRYRVLLLDQRGTGRSTPVGQLPGMTAPEQAEYLTHFRADSIVSDAEHIRRALEIDRWSVLGQSFGGFCVLAYLSRAPEGLREAWFTGGLPPLRRGADEVYALTYERVRERNRRFYERFPEDRERVRRLRAAIESGGIELPDGEPLTWRRVRQLGSMLGMSDGAEHLHHILELPLHSPAFRHDVAGAVPFARNPLYAMVHEASYADGGVTAWSAERMLPPEFADDLDLFTGEHVYPWMFEDYRELAPLREAAQLLAEHEWPLLYDPAALALNQVPCAAAIYTEDMYVERAFSEETAARIPGLHAWVTSEYDHNGLRADGARVLSHLFDLTSGLA